MDVKTIAVIGAGTMGPGIAYAAAYGGYRTALEDVSRHVIQEAMAWIRNALEEGVAGARIEAGVRDERLSLISTACDVKDAIRDSELIIETLPDELEMKLELFTIFDKFAKTGAIFASNTSSLSIADFSDVVVYRERCIGMRFFNPVTKTKLIELVRTPHTSDETVAVCQQVARRMGKEAVLVNEVRGVISAPERDGAER